MSNGVIVFAGDYIRDTDGAMSQIVDFNFLDPETDDTECVLANGRVIHVKDIKMEDVFLESEIVQ